MGDNWQLTNQDAQTHPPGWNGCRDGPARHVTRTADSPEIFCPTGAPPPQTILLLLCNENQTLARAPDSSWEDRTWVIGGDIGRGQLVMSMRVFFTLLRQIFNWDSLWCYRDIIVHTFSMRCLKLKPHVWSCCGVIGIFRPDVAPSEV